MSDRKLKVLFVCLGNICRSPLAEALFREKVSSNGLTGAIEVDSCGTGDWHIGDDPDPRTLDVCRRNELPISHKARQFTPEDFDNYDYIVAMDRSNYTNVMEMAGEKADEERLFLMREYDDKKSGQDVPDPYFGGESGFDQVYSLLDKATDNFLDFIRERHYQS